ncbi:hypothetical protein DT076_16645 [Desertihabitans brevis]|uniref:Uncharacterized protein n=1 Tax=Desertihabitans brevis TaxID=2268447 RepID=A0A367YQW1_9ACTN|nr:hypothetical protein [Desertihabitans brevis]RCK68275.1 hypothetical protein DT076_16645 [Desertihabitans brevis]
MTSLTWVLLAIIGWLMGIVALRSRGSIRPLNLIVVLWPIMIPVVAVVMAARWLWDQFQIRRTLNRDSAEMERTNHRAAREREQLGLEPKAWVRTRWGLASFRRLER